MTWTVVSSVMCLLARGSLGYGRHDGCYVLGHLVYVGGQSLFACRHLTKPPGKKRLPDTSISVDVEQEPAVLVIHRQAEILSVLDHLPLAANETA